MINQIWLSQIPRALTLFNLIPKGINAFRLVTVKPGPTKYSPLQDSEALIKKSSNSDFLNKYISENLQKLIMNYPYCFIPATIFQKYSQIKANNDLLKDLIAFRCLLNVDETQVSQAQDILLPSETNLKKLDPKLFDTRREIFTQHFAQKQQFLKKMFKQSQNPFQRVKYLIVLNNYVLTNQSTALVREIDEMKLLKWDKSGLGLANYIQLLIKNHLPFRHLIPKLRNKLTDPSIQNSEKLKIAKTLITLPYFYKNYEADVIGKVLSIIKYEVNSLSNYELLTIIKLIYEYRSNQSKQLVFEILKLICQMNPQQQPSRADFFVPMMLKALKLASTLNINIEKTVQILYNKPEQLLAILSSISRRHYQTLVLLWQSDKVSPQMLVKIKSHVLEGFKHYLQWNGEVQEEQITKMFNLTLKHWIQFQPQQKITIKSGILKLMEVSGLQMDLVFTSLSIILQQQDQITSLQSNRALISSLSRKYFNSTCETNSLGAMLVKSNIEENIILANLITKNKFHFLKPIPHIQNYNFGEQYLELNILNKYIEYLNFVDSSPSLILDAFTKIQPMIVYFINKKRFSFQTILLAIEASSKCNYQQKYLFSRLQKSIFEILQKFPNFKIKNTELHLIKEHMTSRNLGSKGFQEMIYKALEKPHKWQEIKERYIQHEQEYWRKADQKRKRKK